MANFYVTTSTRCDCPKDSIDWSLVFELARLGIHPDRAEKAYEASLALVKRGLAPDAVTAANSVGIALSYLTPEVQS